MTFAHDRDLLAACPDLLDDADWAGQTTLSTTNATLTTGTLTLSSGSFTDAGVAPGYVLLVDGAPREVTAVASATSCTVSLLRGSAEDDPIPGPDAAAATVACRSYAPQRLDAHDAVLRCLGIDPDRDGAQDTIDGILSVTLMRRLEVFKTLEAIYATLTGTAEQEAGWRQNAAFFRGRFAEVFFHGRVALDLDGDGIVEQERALCIVPTTRA